MSFSCEFLNLKLGQIVSGGDFGFRSCSGVTRWTFWEFALGLLVLWNMIWMSFCQKALVEISVSKSWPHVISRSNGQSLVLAICLYKFKSLALLHVFRPYRKYTDIGVSQTLKKDGSDVFVDCLCAIFALFYSLNGMLALRDSGHRCAKQNLSSISHLGVGGGGV